MGRNEKGLSKSHKSREYFLIVAEEAVDMEGKMIFVTVGTHEQPFNRLIEYIDNMKKNGLIDEEVVMQTGYSTYEPRYCKWQKLFSYQDMLSFINEARIVVTHGGPSSFIMPLQIGKIPVVVPRQKQFNEHINDHQVDFCREVAKRQGTIITVTDIQALGDTILNYNSIIHEMNGNVNSNNTRFCHEFEKMVEELMKN